MGWLGWLRNCLAFRASFTVFFLSWARAVDHHLLEYGVGFETSGCSLIESQMAVFRVVSLWLNESMLSIGAGCGSSSRLALSVGRNRVQSNLQKLYLGGCSAFSEWMSRVVMIG